MCIYIYIIFLYIFLCIFRRKLRSEASDKMDRCSNRGGKIQRRESQKKEDQRRERKKKEDQGAQKGRTVAKHCVFQCFGAPEGRKVGSLKRRVRSHLGWDKRQQTCTPLWHEAHVAMNMLKMLQVRSTFGNWAVGKVHAVVARSAFRSQNVNHSRSAFGSWAAQKVHAAVARSKFRS